MASPMAPTVDSLFAPIVSKAPTMRPLTPPLAIARALSSEISLPLLFSIPPPRDDGVDVLRIPESSNACCLRLIAAPTSSADIDLKPVVFFKYPTRCLRLYLLPAAPLLLSPPCSIANSSSAKALRAALDITAVGSVGSMIPADVLLRSLNGSLTAPPPAIVLVPATGANVS